MKLKELWQLVNAATGFDYASAGEFERIGERISTLARLFNVREGFRPPVKNSSLVVRHCPCYPVDDHAPRKICNEDTHRVVAPRASNTFLQFIFLNFFKYINKSPK
jgi:aldehyde:ferredoxin oxidoreductase